MGFTETGVRLIWGALNTGFTVLISSPPPPPPPPLPSKTSITCSITASKPLRKSKSVLRSGLFPY